MHEDYLMWLHWAEVADKCARDLTALENITSRGVLGGESSYVGS